MAEMQNSNTDGDSTVLCGANSYVEKYYLNEQFSGLPESIKQELQIMCVMYTEDIGGIILLEFMPDGDIVGGYGDLYLRRMITSLTRSEARLKSSSIRRRSVSCWNRWSCIIR